MDYKHPTHQELLHQAIALTHLSPEDTVDLALQCFLAGARPAAALGQYRGKVDLALDLQDPREDRP